MIAAIVKNAIGLHRQLNTSAMAASVIDHAALLELGGGFRARIHGGFVFGFQFGAVEPEKTERLVILRCLLVIFACQQVVDVTAFFSFLCAIMWLKQTHLLGFRFQTSMSVIVRA